MAMYMSCRQLIFISHKFQYFLQKVKFILYYDLKLKFGFYFFGTMFFS